jgi:O-antigen/teichoic acid export membrane protein
VSEPDRGAQAALDAEAENVALGGLARTGMLWSLFNSAAARILNVGSSFVIARVVAPDELGTYAAAVLVLTIVLSMNEVGIGIAVVRWEDRLERILPTAVSAAFLGSLFWAALMFATAPLVAGFLNADGAVTAIRILSVGVLLDGVSGIPAALMSRSFMQRDRAAAELVGFLVGTPVGIFLAARDGAAGLAVGLLVSNAVTTAIIVWRAPARPRPGWDGEIAKALVRMGLAPALTSMLLLAIVNVDSIVVSRVLGVTALGFYAIAFNVASWPLTLLSMSIRQVSLPAFSRLAKDRVALADAFCRSLTLASGLAVLGGVLIVALATPLIGILYGDKWLPAVVALQWLAVLGALRVVLELSYDLLIAVGRGAALLRVQLVWLATLVVALPLGAHLGGIQGVAIAHSAVAVAVVLPLNGVLLVRSGVRRGSLLGALAPVLVATVASVAVAFLAVQVELPRVVELLGVGALVAIVFGLAFLATGRGRSALHWAGLPGARGGGGEVAAAAGA